MKLKSLNVSFVVVIPKRAGASSMKDYKLISLVQSIYKIIFKVISFRLEKVLNETNSTLQDAFVEGRQILLAAFVENEEVDSKSVTKQRVLQMACDHVNLSFLDSMLQISFGLWKRWARFCITSMRYSVLMNGNMNSFFGSSRGLGFGGGGCFSVSLMSFISVTEAMSRMVDRVVMGGFLKGFITAVGCAGTISTSHCCMLTIPWFFVMRKCRNWIIYAKCSLGSRWCQTLKSI